MKFLTYIATQDRVYFFIDQRWLNLVEKFCNFPNHRNSLHRREGPGIGGNNQQIDTGNSLHFRFYQNTQTMVQTNTPDFGSSRKIICNHSNHMVSVFQFRHILLA